MHGCSIPHLSMSCGSIWCVGAFAATTTTSWPVETEAVVYGLIKTTTVNYYTAPGSTTLNPTPCTCNTVLYSMLAACGACQLESYIS